MKSKHEFSKVVVGLLVSTYFIVLVLGIFIAIKLVIFDPSNSVQALLGLFSFVGAVNSISIPFYLHKSEKENINKYPNINTMEEYNRFNNVGQNDSTLQPDPLDNKGENA